MSLLILFENNDIFVFNKPAGLLSVPGRGEDKQDSVETRAKALCPGAVAVHRLDMATSGVMLVAKHKAAERFYKRAFENREVHKTYIALAHGIAIDKKGEIDFPLRCDWENRPRQMVCYTHGKRAKTHYEVLESFYLTPNPPAFFRDKQWQPLYGKAMTRFRLTPITGRSHQLRVHLAEIGHPIIGDNLYAPLSDHGLPRLLLHAQTLIIPQPNSDEQHLFSAPADF